MGCRFRNQDKKITVMHPLPQSKIDGNTAHSFRIKSILHHFYLPLHIWGTN